MSAVAEQTRFSFTPSGVAAFEAYHAANPHIYAALRRFALEARATGRRRISIELLFNRLRWYTDIEAQGDPFKVNNNHRPHYARLLMRDPEIAGLFETRRSAADARTR